METHLEEIECRLTVPLWQLSLTIPKTQSFAFVFDNVKIRGTRCGQYPTQVEAESFSRKHPFESSHHFPQGPTTPSPPNLEAYYSPIRSHCVHVPRSVVQSGYAVPKAVGHIDPHTGIYSPEDLDLLFYSIGMRSLHSRITKHFCVRSKSMQRALRGEAVIGCVTRDPARKKRYYSRFEKAHTAIAIRYLDSWIYRGG